MKATHSILFIGLVAAAISVRGQIQTTGVIGSPDATITISGKQLPPEPEFDGVIKDDALQSKAWWPPRVVPRKGAPNILLDKQMVWGQVNSFLLNGDGVTWTFGGLDFGQYRCWQAAREFTS